MGDNTTRPGAHAQQTPGRTGTAAYIEGLECVSGTVGAFQGIDTYIGGPFRGHFLAQKAETEARTRAERELGEWCKFLYEERNKIYTPVLTSTKFLEYVERCEGAFKPEGSCVGTVPWASLLYALGITPDKGIVSKIFREKGDGECVILEVDGQVICHLVNLLGLLDSNTSQSLIAKSHGRHSTSIGDIHWTQDQETKTISLRYDPCNVEELSSTHKFFEQVKGDRADIMARYNLSLDPIQGTSCASLALPPHTVSLKERIERLSEHANILDDIPDWSVPVFLTGRWFDARARIYRRAFGAEKVDEVIENVCANLDSNSPLYNKAVNDGLRPSSPQVRYDLSHIFPQSSEPFDDSAKTQAIYKEIRSAFAHTLLEYGNEPEESWKYTLYLSREHIPGLLWQRQVNIMDLKKFFVVPLDSTSVLWNGRNLRLMEWKEPSVGERPSGSNNCV